VNLGFNWGAGAADGLVALGVGGPPAVRVMMPTSGSLFLTAMSSSIAFCGIGGEGCGESARRCHSSGNPAARRPGKITVSQRSRTAG
jgi:hypothetical protein